MGHQDGEPEVHHERKPRQQQHKPSGWRTEPPEKVELPAALPAEVSRTYREPAASKAKTQSDRNVRPAPLPRPL
jgi:hypothetical protein